MQFFTNPLIKTDGLNVNTGLPFGTTVVERGAIQADGQTQQVIKTLNPETGEFTDLTLSYDPLGSVAVPISSAYVEETPIEQVKQFVQGKICTRCLLTWVGIGALVLILAHQKGR